MAKDQVVTALLELGIVLHAIPFSRLRRRLRIVVADDQVLAAVSFLRSSLQLPAFAAMTSPRCHLVLGADRLFQFRISAASRSIHVGERPSIQTEDTRIAEMCVAGEKHHPQYLAL